MSTHWWIMAGSEDSRSFRDKSMGPKGFSRRLGFVNYILYDAQDSPQKGHTPPDG